MKRKTRVVRVGDVSIGGDSSITVQSMTNTDTRDAEATVKQILRLEKAGCEIIRSSVYDMDCVKALKDILAQIHIPMVADIHFDYRLAIASMKNGVHKIRFNPGNIGSVLKVRELTACAKDLSIPIRIGVNSGSLEKEMLAKYGGPKPLALVESALKHIAVLESEGFYDIIISIKTSDVKDNVEAYKLLSEKVDYPLHIGVTESGSGTRGLIKSSVGIGALLLSGIGDTLRVSLTGDPEQEIVAAKQILTACGIRREGVEIISCPTCGRCKADLESIVRRVEDALCAQKRYLKVAVMGCAVNGPGEAKEADIGIAFGDSGGVVFKKGELLFSSPLPEAVDRFVEECINMASEKE
ncbi:MAG: 4-hydroxy-3-methylbut-2-en-1-yl diphosphate synthase [Firmicutes bacterium ADurb.Bin182]|nr:MAG: 4-hydroxy-3-methylbut-2-en-1-yl diphosphate synthase [Firmicutes bacterium ADurb.Bin182]